MKWFKSPIKIIIGNRKTIKAMIEEIARLNTLVKELEDKNEELLKKLHNRRNRNRTSKKKAV